MSGETEGLPLVKRGLECECGSGRFVERSPVRGWAIQTIDGKGDPLDHNENAFEYVTPKTVKCFDCGRQYPNPRLTRMFHD